MSLPLLHLDLVARLRADLRAGRFGPGERLSEPDLAERYTAPRAAARAALLVLAHEGLVERKPNQSARVRTLSIEEAIELAEVRGVLEPLCAQRAARRADATEISALTRIFGEMTASTGDFSDQGYVELSNRFHDELTRISGQHAAARYLDELRNLPLSLMYPEAFRTEAGVGHSVEHHRTIVEAIGRRDGAAARQAMIEDLEPIVQGLHIIRNQIVDDS